MARNGITSLLLKEGERRFSISKGPTRSTWIKNIHVHTNPLTRSVFTKRESVHSFVARMSLAGVMKNYEIESFYCNDNIVKVADLYPGPKKYYVAFYIDNGQAYLITTGSKTASEFKTVGSDRFGKSRVPLILHNVEDTDGGTHVEAVNLDPFL
jgi:hypothetical protein